MTQTKKAYKMKKLALSVVFIMSVFLVSAQNSKVQKAINLSKPQYNELDKAKEAIDMAIEHEKTKDNPKTWKVRGQVYQAIAKSEDEKFKSLAENPLKIAIESFQKAQALDEKGKYQGEITLSYLAISDMQINRGVDFFNAGAESGKTEDFAKAFYAFKSALDVKAMVDETAIDTIVIFNAGIAADRGKLFDEAIKFYSKVAELKYEGSKIYGFMANIKKEQGDTAAYVQSLKNGIEAYPEDNTVLMVELINYYLNADISDQALEYLSIAIEKDPTNQTFYFAQGALYDKLKDFDNAKASYEKAVELKSDYFDAYYNLGALFFNKGAELLKLANEIPPNQQKKYDEAVKTSFKELEKALPYLEKAHEIQPTEETTMLTLKEIYFKLRNDSETYMNKFKEMDEKIKALPAKE